MNNYINRIVRVGKRGSTGATNSVGAPKPVVITGWILITKRMWIRCPRIDSILSPLSESVFKPDLQVGRIIQIIFITMITPLVSNLDLITYEIYNLILIHKHSLYSIYIDV